MGSLLAEVIGTDALGISFYRTVFTYATAPEAKAVVLEALGQYILRTGNDRP